MTTTRPMFTVKTAVESCQVSEKTIRRHLPALQEHGASRDDDGQWRIPVEALLAVGLRPGKPKAPDRDQADQPVITAATSGPDLLKDQVVQAELAAAVHRAELAEALLDAERRMTETLRGNVEDLRRQLMPGPIVPDPPRATEPGPVQPTEPLADTAPAQAANPPATPSEPPARSPGRFRRGLARLTGSL